MGNANRISEFRNYFVDRIDAEKKFIADAEKERNEFLKEFPLSRIKEFSVGDYCLGTEQSKDSFCYLIEFGKYKTTGFSIGGGSAKKYGIYYSKNDNSYKHGSNNIENIADLWPQFRDQMISFLTDSGKNDNPVPLEKYPLLQGMAMVLTKLLTIYYPKKYFTIGSYSVLQDLMDYFNYSYESNLRCHQLNYYFYKYAKADIPEIETVSNLYLGHMAWDFIKQKQNEPKKPDFVVDIEAPRYWIYSPGDGASIWDECYKNKIMAIGWDSIGDLNGYNSKEEMQQAMKNLINPDNSWRNGAHATWQFAKEMKPGDIVFAKKGTSQIVGRGIVTSDYRFDSTRKHYKNVRSVNWTDRGEWAHPGKAAMKSLTDITPYTNYVNQLNSLFNTEPAPIPNYPAYGAEDFLEQVYMTEESYTNLVALIRNKKNVILQGSPGVGKTFAAKRLAYSIMGVKDPNRVVMVQFHQSYSYEDFIMGFRPSENGFELKRGTFYNFCKEAEIDSDNDYFFIIDEINRGNLSKIFGELFMLIESDKRGAELQLLYSDEKFSVPKNVYIIGMMNTADRSLAMLDYALRRRFAFFDMKPGFDTDGFKEYRNSLSSEKFDRLIDCVETLNTVIATDESLGEGFCIGHSFFSNLTEATDKELSGIVEYELIPLLKEYWFDEPIKVKDWSDNLRRAIK